MKGFGILVARQRYEELAASRRKMDNVYRRLSLILVPMLLLSSTVVFGQGLRPPEEAEKAEQIERLEKIIKDARDVKAVSDAKCALAFLRGDSPIPPDCKKFGGRRLTRAARVRRAKRIVNGLITVRYPSAGALMKGISSETAYIQCSGTLVACNKFLTAAHCISETPNPNAYWVFFQHSGIYPVSKIEWPKNEYKEKDDEADLAILTLKDGVKGITPTEINRSPNPVPYQLDGIIIGFGRTGGDYTGGPKEDYGIKRVGYVKTAACKASLAKDRHICWNFNSVLQGMQLRSNTCNADSGGPFANDDRALKLYGITTAGDRDSCDLNDHSWDVSISRWRDWLTKRGVSKNQPQSCTNAPLVDVNKHVLGETQRLSNNRPEFGYRIETKPGTKRLSVAMNGEDDGKGSQDFDLYLIEGDSRDIKKAVCSQDGSGQFGYCEIIKPRAGPWRIVVRRKRGEGLAQVTVTEIR